jgi:hypothetical protein
LRETVVRGIDFKLLEDIDPSKGLFVTTRALGMGEQLRALHTKMRSGYNGLLSRIAVSGEHACGGDLLLAAYERTGVENKAKDVALFFYYLVVKDQDLNFLQASLFPDESASEDKDVDISENTESNYAKKQRIHFEKAEKAHIAAEARQLAIIKAVMTPNNVKDSENGNMSQSVIEKNEASADSKKNQSLYYKALASAEKAKKTSCNVDTLMKVMNNATAYELFTDSEKLQIKEKLLLSLNLNN